MTASSPLVRMFFQASLVVASSLAAGCAATSEPESPRASEQAITPPSDCDPSECPRGPTHSGGPVQPPSSAPPMPIQMLQITPTEDGAQISFDTPSADIVSYYVRPRGTSDWTLAGTDATASVAHQFTFTGLDACLSYDFAEVFSGDSQVGDFDARTSPGFFQTTMRYSLTFAADVSDATVTIKAADGVLRPHTGNLSIEVTDLGPRTASASRYFSGGATGGAESLFRVDALVPDETYSVAVFGCGANGGSKFTTPMDVVTYQTGDLGPRADTGNATLQVYSDGSYNFWGHVHDSGFVSDNYVMTVGIALGDADHTILTLAHEGSVAGTDEPWNSRDSDWSISGKSAKLAASWLTLDRKHIHATLQASGEDFANLITGALSPIVYYFKAYYDVFSAIGHFDLSWPGGRPGVEAGGTVCGEVIDGEVVECTDP